MYAAEMAKREQVRKAHRVHAARKQRERRRTALILLVTLISIFIIGVGFGTMLAKAQEPEKSTSEKYYRSICVEKGDTLWDIARVHLGNGSKWTSIYSLNKAAIEAAAKKYGRSSSSNGWWIYPGTVLKLPG